VNSSDAVKETDVLEMVKEDVLRIMDERKEKVSLEVIKAKIRVSHSFISRTIRSLNEEKLIRVENKFIRSTKKGRHEAKESQQL
jgi:Mn-dependent DtxR family transcriptional regulator